MVVADFLCLCHAMYEHTRDREAGNENMEVAHHTICHDDPDCLSKQSGGLSVAELKQMLTFK